MSTESTRCSGFITDLVLRCAARDEAVLGSLFDLFAPIVIGAVGPVRRPASETPSWWRPSHSVWARASRYPAFDEAAACTPAGACDLPGQYSAAS